MGFDDATAPETAPLENSATSEPETVEGDAKRVRAPLSEEQRVRAAERARTRRLKQKLKGAKSEEELKTLAAEVAAPGEPPKAPPVDLWPSMSEMQSAFPEVLGMISEASAQLPLEVLPGQYQGLAMVAALTPAYVRLKKNPIVPKFVQQIDPLWLVPLALLVGFAPQIVKIAQAVSRGEEPKFTFPETPKGATDVAAP